MGAERWGCSLQVEVETKAKVKLRSNLLGKIAIMFSDTAKDYSKCLIVGLDLAMT